jgi:spore germination protein KA
MDSGKATLEEHIQACQDILHHTADLHIEKVILNGIEGALLWLVSMVDQQVIADKLQLLTSRLEEAGDKLQEDFTLEELCKAVLPGAGYTVLDDTRKAVHECLTGKAVILLNEKAGAISVSAASNHFRAVEEPSTQTTIKGPKEGFSESAQINMNMIRRRIIHPDLCFEKFTLGDETQTAVYLVYMDKIINPSVVTEARSRLNKAKPNALFDSGMLEEYITDKTLTPFPLIYTTERPDAISAHIISGKAAIIVDGSPFVISIPTVFSDFFQSSEDYYQPFMISSFIRFIRYVSFLIALLFPAIYLAAITYHFELIPTELLFTISSQRENLPFPVFVEAILMETTFEILREAGIRMPRAVGPTVSIVGGLVIGQAAVEAGIVSNTMVIIVSLTAISSFVSPIYNLSVSTRLLRFGLLTLGALSGFYGVMLGMICMVGHMTSLRSFGVPYTAPFGPLMFGEQRDVVLRFPLWTLKKRPVYLNAAKPDKQQSARSPSPPRRAKKGDKP